MPIAKKTDVPQEFINQLHTNLTKDESGNKNSAVQTNTTETIKENPVLKTSGNSTEGKKDKYADVMNIRLSKGRRNEIKAFCTSNGVTVTQYIESSFEFFAKEVAAGNIIISKGGITKVSK